MKELIKLANHLDRINLTQEADMLDSIMLKLATDFPRAQEELRRRNQSRAVTHNFYELKNHSDGQTYIYVETPEKRILRANRGEGEAILEEAFLNWEDKDSPGWVPRLSENYSLNPSGSWRDEPARQGPVGQPKQKVVIDPSDIAWFEGSEEYQHLQRNYSSKSFDISLTSGDRQLWNTFVRNYGDGAKSFPKPPFAPVIIVVNERCLTENEVRFALAKITKFHAGQEEPIGWEVSWDTNNGSHRSHILKEWSFVLGHLDKALENARGFSYSDREAVRQAKKDMGCAKRRWNPFGRD